MKKNRRFQSGFSLIEVVVAIGIMAIVMAGISSSLFTQAKQIQGIQRNASRNNDLPIFFDYIRSILSHSNIKSFTFLGSGTNGTAIVRLPMPDYCSDLTKNCAGSTNLLIAGQRKPVTSVAAICVLPATANSIKLILDISNSAAYTYSIVGTDIKVTPTTGTGGGTVLLDKGEMSFALTGNRGLVLENESKVNTYDPGYNVVTGDYADTDFGTNPDCLRLSDPTSKLASIELKAWRLPLSGGTFATDAQIEQQLGQMPTLIGNAVIYSIGKKNGESEASVQSCDFTTGVFRCPTEVIKLEDVSRFDFQQLPNQAFSGKSNVELMGFQTDACTNSPDCLTFAITPPVARQIGAETDDKLLATGFSMIKQENISGLVVRLFQKQNVNGNEQDREKSFFIGLY
jgi:prepilin-type N-terminal cleavage/methylation domain-containing protein